MLGGSNTNRNRRSSYPLPAYLNFCPGGIRYDSDINNNERQSSYYVLGNVADPTILITLAAQADLPLNNSGPGGFGLHGSAKFPSLSLLMEAVLHPLTGVPAASVKLWLDSALVEYAALDDTTRGTLSILQRQIATTTAPQLPRLAAAAAANHTSAFNGVVMTSQLVQQLLLDASTKSLDSEQQTSRPCGYVFRHGDIAWNCRTCQTDSTCVLCDSCFHASNHDGHEVFFHRTSPGGCCDCGDIEAWKLEGCCPHHRPHIIHDTQHQQGLEEDGAEDLEAIRVARRARVETEASLKTLPPTLCAALGVVIGAAVQCVLKAVDGSGVGADLSQWKFRWAEQIASIINGVVHEEEYILQNHNKESYLTPHAILQLSSFDTAAATLDAVKAQRAAVEASTNVYSQSLTSAAGENQPLPEAQATAVTSDATNKWDGQFPDRFRLHLRLHNDDVHTYDEVIDSLYKQHRGSATATGADTTGIGTSATGAVVEHHPLRLVADHDSAERMTQHVDADGQVTVKVYDKISSAVAGFVRLKQAGLLCSVVSTPQVDVELRARSVLRWLTDLVKLHPAVAGIVTHALVDVTGGDDVLGKTKCAVWCEPRLRAPWDHTSGELYTREALRKLWLLQQQQTATSYSFYAQVPYRLPLTKFYKSPHALWGTLLSPNDYTCAESTPHYSIIDTDLRKQQETISITTSIYPHRLAGLNLVSGVALLHDGYVNLDGSIVSGTESDTKSGLIASMLTIPCKELQPILSKSSYIAPISPLLIMLLLDPYPTKQFRSVMHNLWLNLLVDGRFKSRFAAALGSVAYRSITTLYCAGVGTEQDSPLGFTVQIFTVKSLISALNSSTSTRLLLDFDAASDPDNNYNQYREETDQHQSNNNAAVATIKTRTLPIALSIVRVLHTNILGSTKEVRMLIEHTGQGHHGATNLPHQSSLMPQLGGGPNNTTQVPNGYLPALVYQNGENPALDILPAAPDDDFLESRTTRHKRLPLIVRDLEYVFEAGTTAMNLLVKNPPQRRISSFSQPPPPVMDFCAAFARLLRLTQGMDIHKRKISGGHVEYENVRWFEAFALSLNLSCCRDALVESPVFFHLQDIGQLRSGMGNLFTALIREIKLFLYREDLLESGLLPASYLTNSALPQAESLQRSTLHVPCLRSSNVASSEQGMNSSNNVALACPTGVKMTEAQLCLIEQALRVEYGPVVDNNSVSSNANKERNTGGVMMGDWLKVPHSPLSGDPLSFHLPLHRALAKAIISFCAGVIPESERLANPKNWWKLPVVDGVEVEGSNMFLPGGATPQTHVAALLAPTLRSSNCKIVWQLPDTSPEHLHMRRLRQYQISSILAAVKVIHSLADLPVRCLVASAQVERHMWSRNGNSVSGMAINYSNAPLCRSFRDLDLSLVQFSAAGFEIGLGVRRVLALLLNRFNMDGYLEDPKFQSHAAHSRRTLGNWKNPPRLQDPEHAPLLAESFFALVCVLVTELPPPPPSQVARDTSSSDRTLTLLIRRELLHTLAAEPKSYSEAFKSISGISRRDPSAKSGNTSESSVSSIRSVFSSVLRTIAKERPSSNSSAGAPAFELVASCSDEYDPNFYHLRRMEHQHAMDVIARLRHQKCKDMAAANAERKRSPSNSRSSSFVANDIVLPIVPPPPEAHPRFLPARLLLHLPALDAAIRRKLLYALFGGEWVPPEPLLQLDDSTPCHSNVSAASSDEDGEDQLNANIIIVPRTVRAARVGDASTARKSAHSKQEFAPRAVQSSSVSSLEVLQLLTLQIHTLESMASLHRSLLGDSLDPEAKELSRSLNVNRYLSRLIYVPDSLESVWAIDPRIGPLPSAGSGKCRGSILGVLLALWEHSYSCKSSNSNAENSADKGVGMSSSGGARVLASDGLKWIIRFVHSLVDGASSVKAAILSATEGVRISSGSATAGWTLSRELQETIQEMLKNIPKLWPGIPITAEALSERSVQSMIYDNASSSSLVGTGFSHLAMASDTISPGSGGNGDSPSNDFKAKLAARKAAQMAALERMKKQQAMFAASLAAADDDGSDADAKDSKPNADLDLDSEEERGDSNECIICRCGAQDSDSLLCFLGHVQRSRVLGMRNLSELSSNGPAISANGKVGALHVGQAARVVGDRGCQLRMSYEMDSAPVACLPMGSIVFIVQSKASTSYGILSRRVFVRHVLSKSDEASSSAVEGWASVQSSQGYVILAPLTDLCSGRWSSTRPILRLCGHAAHLGCVDSHCLSLQERAAGDHPYDGRFAANIEEGEFLCPLCKQLSNVLVPSYYTHRLPQTNASVIGEKASVDPSHTKMAAVVAMLKKRVVAVKTDPETPQPTLREAATRFGDHLYQAMEAPWMKSSRKKESRQWSELLSRWDFDDSHSNDDDSVVGVEEEGFNVGSIMKHLRQLHISWALLGHGAASSESSARYAFSQFRHNGAPKSWSIESNYGRVSTGTETLETRVSDPWPDYSASVRDSHLSLVEAKRIMLAMCGVFDTISRSLGSLTASHNAVDDAASLSRGSSLLGLLLSDILEGRGSGLPNLLDPTNTSLKDPMLLLEWKLISACLASTPCHVARDGVLSRRSDARAVANGMWILDGLCVNTRPTASISHSSSKVVPPMPLAARKLIDHVGSGARLPQRVGTSSVTKYFELRAEISDSQNLAFVAPPFRPALASGFLYMPLLAWDLNSLCGALFSALIHSGTATTDDLVAASQLLLAGRLVQALVSPNGYKVNADAEARLLAQNQTEGLPRFTLEVVMREAQALLELQVHCHQVIDSTDTCETEASAVTGQPLLEAIGNAVLPFARTLVLLLRAGFSILRSSPHNEQKGSPEYSSASVSVARVLEDPLSMTCQDGLRLFKALGGPLPSELITDITTQNHRNGWLVIVDRWLAGIVNLESHHGSRGRSNRYDSKLNKFLPQYIGGVDNELHPCVQHEVGTSITPFAGQKSDHSTETNALEEASRVFYRAGASSGNEERPDHLTEASEFSGVNTDADDYIDGSSFEGMDPAGEDADMDDVTDDEHMVNDFLGDNFLDANDTEGSDNLEMTVETIGDPILARATSPSSDFKVDDDETGECSVIDGKVASENVFADVGSASIIPFQPSFLARESLGPGPRGSTMDLIASSRLLYDMSHLGLVHHRDSSGSGLIRLPYSFVELYTLVNKVRGDSIEESDENSNGEAVICLLTGSVLRSGSPRRGVSRLHSKPPGACTLHSRKVGSGVGIFFLIQKCIVLLVHNNKSAYSPSLFVDENGEEDLGLKRGRPLFLNEARLQALESLWRNNGIPREVAQIRSTSDRVIRDNWY